MSYEIDYNVDDDILSHQQNHLLHEGEELQQQQQPQLQQQQEQNVQGNDFHLDDEQQPIELEDDHDDHIFLAPSIHDDLSIASPDQHYQNNHPLSLDEDDDSPLQHSWRLTNAVHMEIQENAKLPTFHMNVDRSGSSTTNKFDFTGILQQFFNSATNTTNDPTGGVRRSRSNTITDDISLIGDDIDDDLLQMDDGPLTTEQQLQQPTLNLTEYFLSSEKGLRHTNFPTHKSSRYTDVPKVSNVNTAVVDTTSVKQDDEDINLVIDPTPLSEMQRKYNNRHRSTGNSTASVRDESVVGTNNNSTIVATSINTGTQQQQQPLQQQFWSRQEPLPIPSRVQLSNTVDTTAHNHQNTTTSNKETALLQSSAIPSSITFTANDATIAKVPSNKATNTTKFTGSRNIMESPQHSLTHSVSRPAVEVASLKHTQYGFGRKHVVPSIPTGTTPATTKKRSYNRTSSGRSQNSTIATTAQPGNKNSKIPSKATTSKIVRAPSTTMSNEDYDDDSGTGSGGVGGGYSSNLAGNVAYERKKERAKTARVRLNESIDRLQIALNMAGTQSKQRLAMFQEQTIPYRIIADCVKCSEDAKKWDRPSFVGSAATMIQCLNAQCEALARALHDERHKRIEQPVNAAIKLPEPIHTATPSPTVVEAELNNSSNYSGHTSSPTKVDGDVIMKRQKLSNDLDGGYDPLNDLEYVNVFEQVMTDMSCLKIIGSYLDPLSVIRCLSVSRTWKDCGVFTSDELWQQLAIARFGSYNVRQWITKTEDYVHGESHSSAKLYKSMDALNVMPNCRLGGMLFLGESRLMGKVSAWTYLVERSNGETIRSVLRPSTVPGTGMYTSLPVVQIRTIIQNTGTHNDTIVVREQKITVDASTRRKGDEMVEIDWDNRFRKQTLNLDGSIHITTESNNDTNDSRRMYEELCRLRLYDAVIVEAYIHARGCSTTSKFVQKSNFTKILIQICDGTTVPLVIPFHRDASHLLP